MSRPTQGFFSRVLAIDSICTAEQELRSPGDGETAG
jgi:hypothetical protein